jgi:probable F420-dependent oxidoreductase
LRFSVSLPAAGHHSTWQGISDVTAAAEELGFSGIHALDHLLAPRANTEPYGRIFEPMVTLSNLAARTRRLKLVTSVLIVAMRDPVTVAKQAATLDVISGGRLMFGVGAGWLPEEFANVGADFHTRGARTDETIRLCRHLWSGSLEPFHGRFTSFDDFTFEPLPLQGASVPILVGGHSDAALKRAATLGDAWQGTYIGMEPGQSLRDFRDAVGRLREVGSGRRIAIGARIWWGAHLAGTSEEMAAQVREWEEAGCEDLTIAFGPADVAIERMRRFADEVMPALA